MQIPTISLASRDATRLANLETALTDTGFMLLSDTGIEEAQISAVFEASRSFFQCSDEFKQRFRYHGATDNFGYQSVGMESLDPDRPPDLKEALTVRNPSARRRLSVNIGRGGARQRGAHGGQGVSRQYPHRAQHVALLISQSRALTYRIGGSQ